MITACKMDGFVNNNDFITQRPEILLKIGIPGFHKLHLLIASKIFYFYHDDYLPLF